MSQPSIVQRHPSFIRFIFEGQLNAVAALCTVAALLLVFLPVLNLDALLRALVFSVVAILVFTTILFYRARDLFGMLQISNGMVYLKLNLLKQKGGEGSYLGVPIFVIENPGTLRDNLLMTVYATSSGIPQPIGFIQIVNAQDKDGLLAVAYPTPNNPAFTVDKYFNNEKNTYSLFVSPLVHAFDLRSLGNIFFGYQPRQNDNG